ncbi:MAG: hypothetical protein KAS97_03435 [Candidatus Aminicenantes bacterium]|nr:hypothetical protein [Candidatus Aminicenantes bacterium]
MKKGGLTSEMFTTSPESKGEIKKIKQMSEKVKVLRRILMSIFQDIR